MKTKLLLYCTKGKENLYKDYYVMSGKEGYFLTKCGDVEKLNGKIVAECECEVEELINLGGQNIFETKKLDNIELLDKSCLCVEELDKYLVRDYEDAKGYALHLSNLKAFEETVELKECKTYKKFYNSKNTYNVIEKVLTNAPQNMMRVLFNKEEYVLISIRPEWLCKILNGDKTIEVRRKVLKRMI